MEPRRKLSEHGTLCSSAEPFEVRRNFGLIIALMLGYNLSGTLIITNVRRIVHLAVRRSDSCPTHSSAERLLLFPLRLMVMHSTPPTYYPTRLVSYQSSLASFSSLGWSQQPR